MKKKLSFGCFLLTLIAANNAAGAADTIVRDRHNEQLARQVFADTRVCLADAVKVMVMQGVRDDKYIADWAANTCSAAMNGLAATVKEMPKDTHPMLIAMAYKEMLKIPGLVPPPKK
jgi:hypothetical protein